MAQDPSRNGKEKEEVGLAEALLRFGIDEEGNLKLLVGKGFLSAVGRLSRSAAAGREAAAEERDQEFFSELAIPRVAAAGKSIRSFSLFAIPDQPPCPPYSTE